MKIKKPAAILLAAICLTYPLNACGADETSTADASSKRTRREQAEEEASSNRDQNDRNSTDADDEKGISSAADTEMTTAREATTSSTTTTAAASTTTTAAETAAVTTGETEADKSEPAVVARSGDAYLALADGIWWAQYWGESDSDNIYLNLCYDAGVVHINGDGQYTVSVTADTDGARYDATGDVNGELTLDGIGYCSLVIKGGETVCPEASIRIDSILIDGERVEPTAKNYTYTADGDLGSYIYNPWVSDAGAQIIDVDQISDWQTIEVSFTVKGLG